MYIKYLILSYKPIYLGNYIEEEIIWKIIIKKAIIMLKKE